jgi:tight adherence protein C
MSVVIALMLGTGIVMITTAPRSLRLADRVGRYLRPEHSPRRVEGELRDSRPLADAGLGWSSSEFLVRRIAACVGGAIVGLLLAQGDLFVEGPERATLPLAVLGAAAGWLLFGMWLSTRRQRRARQLRFELPVVTDAVALHIVAGESVATAVERFAKQSNGVASQEFKVAIEEVSNGRGIAEALQRNVRRTADPEAARLYTLLAHAHDTGGRLGDALAQLGADYRAALARDLTSEGGRRALAIYGPVLALMVPVTLLFLLYPTLAGLRSLAGSP